MFVVLLLICFVLFFVCVLFCFFVFVFVLFCFFLFWHTNMLRYFLWEIRMLVWQLARAKKAWIIILHLDLKCKTLLSENFMFRCDKYLHPWFNLNSFKTKMYCFPSFHPSSLPTRTKQPHFRLQWPSIYPSTIHFPVLQPRLHCIHVHSVNCTTLLVPHIYLTDFSIAI